MTWLQRYRVRNYVRNSIWILPLCSAALALIALRSLHLLDEAMGWKSEIDPETARTVLATMASAMFTFIVFVCSLLLVALQLASAQLTPRIIAAVFRDPVTKFSLSVFVFTFTFSLAVLVRIGTSVPLVTTYLAAYGCLASLGLFLFLIVDIASKALSPAINDPTTAILAIDQIHHLLRSVGGRDLNDGHVSDEAGRLRLVTPPRTGKTSFSLASPKSVSMEPTAFK